MPPDPRGLVCLCRGNPDSFPFLSGVFRNEREIGEMESAHDSLAGGRGGGGGLGSLASLLPLDDALIHSLSLVRNEREIGGMESAHDSFIWSLSWHPLGHILCSGSNDHTRYLLSLCNRPYFTHQGCPGLPQTV